MYLKLDCTATTKKGVNLMYIEGHNEPIGPFETVTVTLTPK